MCSLCVGDSERDLSMPTGSLCVCKSETDQPMRIGLFATLRKICPRSQLYHNA